MTVSWNLPDEDALPRGHVDLAAWLAPDLLLATGWFPADDNDTIEAAIRLGSTVVPLDIEVISFPRLDVSHAGPRAGKVIVIRFPERMREGQPLGQLLIDTGDASYALVPDDLAQVVTNLQTVLDDGVGLIDAQASRQLLDLIAALPRRFIGLPTSQQLGERQRAVRDVLRLPTPQAEIDRSHPRGMSVEMIAQVDARSFYVCGWSWDGEAPIARLTAIAPDGQAVDILTPAYRYSRSDIEQFYQGIFGDRARGQSGFACYFTLPYPCRLPEGWIVEAENAAGIQTQVLCPPSLHAPTDVRNGILGHLGVVEPADELMANHIKPALTQFQERNAATARVARIDQFGAPPDNPDISLIVPLYQRIDFVEHQLAQFSGDPELAETDLIYVLDSPEQRVALLAQAQHLSLLYRVPFRIMTLERNVGFAAANNLGVEHARGRLLLLLNSDVLPDRPGWLGTMQRFYDRTPKIGALGPKLLFEDDSLQHAGMYMSRASANDTWENLHYFKGMHRSLPAANVVRRVPLVTAACMMIGRKLYQEIGGLRGMFVQGDYEDSDLCLRLAEAGYEIWYLPDAELYHLEGQSYPTWIRQLTTVYNRWLHDSLWNEPIAQQMSVSRGSAVQA